MEEYAAPFSWVEEGWQGIVNRGGIFSEYLYSYFY
jgi:hypothetical protein